MRGHSKDPIKLKIIVITWLLWFSHAKRPTGKEISHSTDKCNINISRRM